MGATHIELPRGRLRELRGAMLALIMERPGHGYELWNRLESRLGPGWQLEAKQMYPFLDEFARDGLARAVEEPVPGRRRQTRTVYYPTELTLPVLRHWMRSDFELAPRRPDVIARLTSATQEDAEALLHALDEYEAELLRMLEANDDITVPARSWRGLLLSIARDHTDGWLQAEFQWIVVARRRIREFVAAQ